MSESENRSEMTEVTFTVPGPPVAKGRPRRAPDGHWYTPTRTREFEQRVAWSAIAAGVKLEQGVYYAMDVGLCLSNNRRDVDNIVKSVLDGLQQLETDFDDRQVVRLFVKVIPVREAEQEETVVTIKKLPEKTQALYREYFKKETGEKRTAEMSL